MRYDTHITTHERFKVLYHLHITTDADFAQINDFLQLNSIGHIALISHMIAENVFPILVDATPPTLQLWGLIDHGNIALLFLEGNHICTFDVGAVGQDEFDAWVVDQRSEVGDRGVHDVEHLEVGHLLQRTEVGDISLFQVEDFEFRQGLNGSQARNLSIGDVEALQVGEAAHRHQVLHVGISRKVEFLHVDDFVKLLGGRLAVEFDLLREDGFPIDGQSVPPVHKGFGIVNDQSEWVAAAEITGFGDADFRIVAINLAQLAMATQWCQILDVSIAAIQLVDIL